MLPRKRFYLLLLLCLVLLQGLQLHAQITTTSNAKARELAQQIMKQMGGRKNWDNTRYLAWTFKDQYQIWDKHQNKFRWENDSLVAIINTQTKEGKVYVAGREVQNPEETLKLRERAYAMFINNSYWLVMPFKLLDPGVNLTYIGEGKTTSGAPADVLEMTFEKVGLTPQNKYKLWVDKEQKLITQWAFYRNATDTKPTFTRRWADYKLYGNIKLADNRSNPTGDFFLTDIAVPDSVPDAIFNSPKPVARASIK
ncbi:hypothetical protein [Pontibacter vulgaris]|uniref:hypothetical protein n=1 Tax=Pontibacter vulgaris TaxID=2905679 RepID=UPI001FA6EAF1|nr:hypothetical protein [Pontibacter vulgaris]